MTFNWCVSEGAHRGGQQRQRNGLLCPCHDEGCRWLAGGKRESNGQNSFLARVVMTVVNFIFEKVYSCQWVYRHSEKRFAGLLSSELRPLTDRHSLSVVMTRVE